MQTRIVKFIAVQLAVLVLAAAAVVVYRGRLASAGASVLSNSVIVELKDDPAAVYKAKAEKAGRTVSEDELQAYRESLLAKQEQFLSALRAKGVAFELESVGVPDFDGRIAANVPFRFTLVYNGVTLKVPSDALSAVGAMPEVKGVHQNGVKRVALDRSVKYIKAPEVYGEVPELTRYDNTREGFEGQGINIAVLDTGIDWSHEMFGADPSPPRLGVAHDVDTANTNKKVIYYLSFTGGLLDGYGHGTHSSADAAGYLGFAPGADKLQGTADDERVHGVAPQARLMGYKVCADVGSCVDASTILAIEDAVSPRTLTGLPKPVAHVINMSLGGAGGPDDATAAASDNAALLGTIVVASAGNDGPGEGTVGSPAAGRHVIAVGANTDPGAGVNTADLADGSLTGMKAVALEGSAPVTADITNNYVYCGLAETIDQVPDSVAGRVALISRGSTVNTPELPVAGSLGTGLFQTKAYNATAKGAIAVLFINNAADENEELTAATVRAATIPVLGLSRKNGEALKNRIGSTAFGAVSAKQVRVNASLVFSPDMADFSSRGPVLGYGQIKPDVTAPGVDILSATVRAGSADANTGTMFDPTGYIAASGTSFSGPHVTGAAALIKQAHPRWTPAMVRTAMINTATNLRAQNGTPKADSAADSVIAQGGGLIDVKHAVGAKALLGVPGDGIVKPSILGSHSFGEVPVINSRTTSTQGITVTINDVSGQVRTYNLSAAVNRDASGAGLSVGVGPSSVTVPANGSATFTVTATIDGDALRALDPEHPIQMQWYAVATSADGESLRMPFYLKPVPSVPANSVASVDTYTGNVAVGDGALQLAEGVSYVDVPFEVAEGIYKIDGRLDFPQIVEGLVHDLDFALLDPDGNQIDDSADSGGPEFVSARVTRAGTYVYRVIGFVNASTDFKITSTQSVGNPSEPPLLSAIAGEFADAGGRQIDYDGNFALSWQTRGGERGFEVERSADGGESWATVATLPADAASYPVSNEPNGTYSFRVRAHYPGQIGLFVSDPSNAQEVTVDRRTLVDITGTTKGAFVPATYSFDGSVTQLEWTLTNSAAKTFYPRVLMRVVKINSDAGGITVANADNGASGVNSTNGALFDYTPKLGAEQEFGPSEKSESRVLRFNNPTGQLFSFDAVVTAYERQGATEGGVTEITSAPYGEAPQRGTSGSSPLAVTRVMRVTVNPLTRGVTVQLLSVLPLR